MSAMGKERYRLQTVLDIRRKARDGASALVGLRRDQLTEAERELMRREGAVLDCRNRINAGLLQLDDVMRRGVAANKIIVHRTHLAGLRAHEAELIRHVEQQQARVAQARGELEKALESLKEAAKELQAVEKHREQWRETERRQMEKREQKLSDEISASNHARQRPSDRS